MLLLPVVKKWTTIVSVFWCVKDKHFHVHTCSGVLLSVCETTMDGECTFSGDNNAPEKNVI